MSDLNEQIAALKAAAEAATPGPWFRSDRPTGPFWHIWSEHTVGGERCRSGRQAIGHAHAANKRNEPEYAAMFEANASFIAAANPAAVLALIAEVESARRAPAPAASVQVPADERKLFDKWLGKQDHRSNSADDWEVWQARAALAAPAVQAEPVAWMAEDGRVQPMSAMKTARRVGGATASAMRPYMIPLVRGDAAPASADDAKDCLSLLDAEELGELRRFVETCEDDEGYDVTKTMMQRLAIIGAVRRTGGTWYEATEFGMFVLERAALALAKRSQHG